MNLMPKLLDWSECVDKSQVGNKAYNLAMCKKQGLIVPDFKVIGVGDKPSEEEVLSFVGNKLVAVRSGSAVSLPGLMVSFLNVSKKDVMDKIQLVQDSWCSPITQEVKNYLQVSDLGTAVMIQDMVPQEELIGSGVASIINPVTKNFELCVSYKANEYGEAVVLDGAKDSLPKETAKELIKLISQIEAVFSSHQEIEFCVTTKGLVLLQTRNLVFKENLFNDEIKGSLIGSGLGSSQGVVSGRVCFENPSEGDILCLKTANPSQIKSLIKAKAILTKSGDHNSHLAILCRLLKKPYILQAQLNSKLSSNQELVLDTNSGKIYLG